MRPTAALLLTALLAAPLLRAEDDAVVSGLFAGFSDPAGGFRRHNNLTKPTTGWHAGFHVQSAFTDRLDLRAFYAYQSFGRAGGNALHQLGGDALWRLNTGDVGLHAIAGVHLANFRVPVGGETREQRARFGVRAGVGLRMGRDWSLEVTGNRSWVTQTGPQAFPFAHANWVEGTLVWNGLGRLVFNQP